MLADSGKELDSVVSLVMTGSHYQLTFESSGESGRRNGQYRQVFELALIRLASLGAVIHDGRVESRVTRDWDAADKRLLVTYAPYPVQLSTIADLVVFAKDLRTAGARVGNNSGRGGNPTKRISLEFSLPASFEGALTEVAGNLFGLPRSSPPSLNIHPDFQLHKWWVARPTERYWLEITGRDDLGADLRAPLTNEHGRPFWSYSLLRCVRRGDVVFHYHRNEGAIVAVSRATGTQWADVIVWAARGSSARDAGIEPHTRPGWYVGLEQFKPLATPLSLQLIRAADQVLRTEVDTLKRDVGEPLYFPMELSDSREARPMQGYLFKLPRFFAELFPQLAAEATVSNRPISVQSVVPGEYRRAAEQASVAAGDPFSIDPAVKERALRSHAVTQNALADFLVARGFTPRSAVGSQPNFDIAWEDGDTLWVGEVKSLTYDNEEKQLRLGLGQVLRYRYLIGQTRKTRAALITEREPSDKTWLSLCEALGIAVAWPGNWQALVP